MQAKEPISILSRESLQRLIFKAEGTLEVGVSIALPLHAKVPIGVAYCKHFICAFVVELERLNFFQQGQRIGLRLCTATCSLSLRVSPWLPVHDSSHMIFPGGSPETIHSNGFLRPWLMRGFCLRTRLPNARQTTEASLTRCR